MARMNTLSQAVDALSEAMDAEDDWEAIRFVCSKIAKVWRVDEDALYNAYRERIVGV